MKNKTLRIFAALAALVVVALLSSCEKEGKLSKRIQLDTVTMKKTVYLNGQEMYQISEQRTQQWFWEGNNLFRIDYTEDESSYSELIFTQHHRIVKTQIDAYGIVSTFCYDGRRLDTIHVSVRGLPAYCCIFTHDDNKISSMLIHPYSTAADSTAMAKGPLHLLPLMGVDIPQQIVDRQIDHIARLSDAKSAGDVLYEYRWNKDNVASMKVTYADGTAEDYIYEYDENKNPYRQCFTYYECNDGDGLFDVLSENNILSITTYYDRQSNYKFNYTYTYDDKLPVTSQLVYTYHAFNNQDLEESVFTVKEERTYSYVK